ncbi:gp48 protein [Escherichia phage K1E]|uniref:Gp48 protein n=1 Tax=Escherichia phage K1E TaxID=344022 RepID=Q2WC57_BPK1E|nr:hypothetical protein PK1Ep62 [Escherichia phage K1E]CAJ29459.1 gp48 protein [Escherichia phage K1E]
MGCVMLDMEKVEPQCCTRINQSKNFDIGVCQLSRPRPRRIFPIWGRAAVGLGIGLGWAVFNLLPQEARWVG